MQSDPRPIVDRDERVIAVLAGQPRDSNWDGVGLDAAEAMRRAGEQLRFPRDQKSHRRGKFTAGAYGYSYGGGQKACLPFFCAASAYPSSRPPATSSKASSMRLFILLSSQPSPFSVWLGLPIVGVPAAPRSLADRHLQAPSNSLPLASLNITKSSSASSACPTPL